MALIYLPVFSISKKSQLPDKKLATPLAADRGCERMGLVSN
jgi:hypothetical protein